MFLIFSVSRKYHQHYFSIFTVAGKNFVWFYLYILYYSDCVVSNGILMTCLRLFHFSRRSDAACIVRLSTPKLHGEVRRSVHCPIVYTQTVRGAQMKQESCDFLLWLTSKCIEKGRRIKNASIVYLSFFTSVYSASKPSIISINCSSLIWPG